MRGPAAESEGAAYPPEWRYPPPPTVYDLVRDNALLRALRLLVHLPYRASMRCWHRLDVRGAENVPAAGPCLIAPNHSSHLDALAIFASLPASRVNATCAVAAKDYFFRNPVVALAARLLVNCIPFDRTGHDARALRLCAARIREGKRLIIFPEGTRSATGEIGAFKPGAVALGRMLMVPVVPAWIGGARESLPKDAWFPRGGKITVIFGEALRFWEGDLGGLSHGAAAGTLEAAVRALKDRLGHGGDGRCAS
ncbi:MAG: lysophospholipid acyltransferase family protein [bacterium]|nr:lysophospholipid acyltransferase family protein [bacterium]